MHFWTWIINLHWQEVLIPRRVGAIIYENNFFCHLKCEKLRLNQGQCTDLDQNDMSFHHKFSNQKMNILLYKNLNREGN